MSPHETLFRLEATQSLERSVVDHTSLCRFTIWDFPGDYYALSDDDDAGAVDGDNNKSGIINLDIAARPNVLRNEMAWVKFLIVAASILSSRRSVLSLGMPAGSVRGVPRPLH